MHRNEQIISNYKEKTLNNYLNEAITAEKSIFSNIQSDKQPLNSSIYQQQLFFKDTQINSALLKHSQSKTLKNSLDISRITNKLFTINQRIDYCKELLLMADLINSFHIRKRVTHCALSPKINQQISEWAYNLSYKKVKRKDIIRSAGRKMIISKLDIERSKIKRIICDIYSITDISSAEVSILNKISIINDNELMALVPQHLTPELQDLLYQIILFSKESDTVSLAASNAATMLSRSNFLWKNLDLSGVKIPYADLSRQTLININFENSNLQGVNFQQSSIEFTNFNGCNLSDISFDEIFHIKTVLFEKIRCVSFSSCGKYLGFMDSKFHIWNVVDQNEENKFGIISSRVLWFSFSNAVSYIALCASSHIQIREIESEKVIHQLKGKFDFVLFSPNNAYLFAMSKNTAYFWNPETFKLVLKIEGWAVLRGFIRFSKNSKYISGYHAGTITVWEIANKRKIEMAWPISNDLSLSFFPNEKYLAINDNHLCQLWDFNPKGNLTELKICKDIKMIEFSPCGNFALLLDHSHTIRIWNIDANEQIELCEKCQCNNELVAFSKCTKLLAFSKFDNLIKIVKLPGKDQAMPRKFTNGVSCISLSSSGKYLASGHFNEKIKLWDMRSFILLGAYWHWIDDREFNVLSIAFSPCENYFIFPIGWQVFIHEINSQLCVQTINILYSQQVLAIAMSYCGKYMAYAQDGGYCSLWDIVSSECLQTLETAKPLRNQVLFSPCQRYLAYGYKDSVRLWSFENQKFTTFEAFDAAFSFSPCKQFLATLKTGFSIEIWDLNNFTKTSELQLHQINSDVFTFTYSACSNYLICYHKFSRTEENVILSVWNAQNKKEVTQFFSHSKFIGKAYSIYNIYADHNCLASAGSYFACAGNDGAIKIWNLDGITGGLPVGSCLDHILNFGNMHVFNCTFVGTIISNKTLKFIIELPYHSFIDRIR